MPSRKQYLFALVVAAIVVFASVSMFRDADTVTWPVFGLRPVATRVFAVAVGGYFFLMFLDGIKRLFLKGPPSSDDTAGVSDSTGESDSLTPVQRAAAQYLHLLPLHGIQEGHVPTVAEIELLADDLNDDSKWPGAFDAMDYAALWVDRAPVAALDSMLALLDSGRPIANLHEDDVDDGLVLVLGHWGLRHLHPWLEEMEMRLGRPGSRAAAFAVLSWNPCAEVLPLLAPWLPRVNELNEAEQLIFISLFGDVESPQSLAVLQQVQATLRDPSDEVGSELQGYIRQHEERDG